MTNQTPGNLYKLITSIILYSFGIVILLWFLYKIVNVIFLLIFALVFAIVINAPVSKLEKKGYKRWVASTIVLSIIFLIIIVLGWLIVPRLGDQINSLVNDLPEYYSNLSKNVSGLLKNHPELNRELQESGFSLSNALPSMSNAVTQLGSFSISILGGIFLLIVFISMICYAVTNPRPLVELYLSVFKPSKRAKAEKAMQDSSTMLIGWIRSNLIGGAIEAVLTGTFLTIMQVPGALVWAALAFFSELVPKIGFYIMAIPPILVALSVSPMTAFWCLIFFLAMNELIADLLMPKLRSTTMKIHPVSSLFLLLAFGTAFGLVGALLATPLAAIIKAFYEEFYLTQFEEDNQMEKRIDNILYKKT